MSPLCYFLSVLTVAFAIGCVLFRRKGKSFEGMLCKFMSSFGFISVAIVGYLFNPENVWYSYGTFMYKFFVQNSINADLKSSKLPYP